jgi:PAS domain S-box-containing protein
VVLGLVPWVVLAVGLGASLAFWRYLEIQQHLAREAMLGAALGQARDGVMHRLEEDEMLLDGAGALLAGQPRPSPEQWQSQISVVHPHGHHPGLAFLAYLPLETLPSGRRALVAPEPLAESLLAPEGLLNQPKALQVLAQAREKGTTILGGRVDLPGEGALRRGYLMARPLYRGGLPSGAKDHGFAGWVVAGFNGQEAFRSLFGSRPVPGLDVHLADEGGTGLIFDRELGDPGQPIPAGPFSRHTELSFAGRAWSMDIGLVPGAEGTAPVVPSIVLLGLAATALCFALTLALARGHARLEDLAHRLHESEEGFRAMTETASCAILIYSDTIEYINPAGAEMLGWTSEELAGQQRLDFVHPLDREWMARRWEARRRGEAVPSRYEFRVLTRNGETRWMDLSVTTITLRGKRYGLGTALDVTERVRTGEERMAMERRLLDAQKLESLGLLAGGIAHDFNNLLAVIQGNAGILREETLDREDTEACLGKIEETCKRAADLVHQMLAYSGRGQLQVRPMDLNRELSEILHLLEVSLPKGATLDLLLSQSLPAMQGDPSQVHQVVLNLITNAAEALKEGEGHISVRTSLVTLDAEAVVELRAAEAMRPGDFLLLEVEDDGAGMDEETQNRVFDPFFTTKFTGRGLGLAAMQGIVRGHQGGVWLRSVPGQGTTFRIYFPALGQPLEALPPAVAAGPARFEGLALVADDEPGVRDLLRIFLEGAGFHVIQALDGIEALDLFQVHGEQLALVVLDGAMPRLGGVEALSRMRLLRPDLPALLVSGWGVDEAPEGVQALAKPFTRQGLMEAVRRALNGARV